MHKSTIISHCLVNSSMIQTVEAAETAVRAIFDEERPQVNFVDWNTEVDEKVAAQIIASVGRAGRINVAKFIADLDD